MNTSPHCKATAAGLAVVLLAGVLGQGCAGRHAVIAATGTVLGLDISENPQTQLYHVKFGYTRGELAIVPSNRSAEKNTTATNSRGHGATDTADVLMELRYGGIKSSGIYQRLAVGKTAVSQPGAAFMLAKDADGALDEKTAKAVSSAVGKIPAKDAVARIESLDGMLSYLQALPPEKYPDAAATADKVKSLAALVPANYDFTRYTWDRGNVKIDSSVTAIAAATGYDKFKEYRGTLATSVKNLTIMAAPPLAGVWKVAGTPLTTPTPAQLSQAADDLKTQTQLLEKTDAKFAENADVENAFAYFTKVASN